MVELTHSDASEHTGSGTEVAVQPNSPAVNKDRREGSPGWGSPYSLLTRLLSGLRKTHAWIPQPFEGDGRDHIPLIISISFLSRTFIWALHRDYNTSQVKQESYIEYSLQGTCDQKLRAVRETDERKPHTKGGPGRKTPWAQILTPPLTVCRTLVSVFTSLCLSRHTCVTGITKCLSRVFDNDTGQ